MTSVGSLAEGKSRVFNERFGNSRFSTSPVQMSSVT